MAIYVKVSMNCLCVDSISKPKSFELSAIKLNFPNGVDLTVVGCYRPPSASPETTALLSEILHKFSDNKLILLGDFNWDWLSTSKHMDKSTLLDIILTNAPHKYTAVRVSCNDVSDHCTIACVRSCKLLKAKPQFIYKKNYKSFNEQAFLHEVYHSDLNFVCEMADVELAWDFFKTTFLSLVDKYAPFEKV